MRKQSTGIAPLPNSVHISVGIAVASSSCHGRGRDRSYNNISIMPTISRIQSAEIGGESPLDIA